MWAQINSWTVMPRVLNQFFRNDLLSCNWCYYWKLNLFYTCRCQWALVTFRGHGPCKRMDFHRSRSAREFIAGSYWRHFYVSLDHDALGLYTCKSHSKPAISIPVNQLLRAKEHRGASVKEQGLTAPPVEDLFNVVIHTRQGDELWMRWVGSVRWCEAYCWWLVD